MQWKLIKFAPLQKNSNKAAHLQLPEIQYFQAVDLLLQELEDCIQFFDFGVSFVESWVFEEELKRVEESC